MTIRKGLILKKLGNSIDELVRNDKEVKLVFIDNLFCFRHFEIVK